LNNTHEGREGWYQLNRVVLDKRLSNGLLFPDTVRSFIDAVDRVVSDIVVFVLKRDVKLQPTNQPLIET